MNEENESEDINKNAKAKGPRFGMRHIQILMLFLNITCIFMSRLNVSVAVVAMTNAATTNPNFPEFTWSEIEKNYIISSFYWGYIIPQFPAGYLNRLYGAKRIIIVCTFCSAIVSLLTPYLVTLGNWQMYCGIRIVQGLFQGSIFPSINDHIAKWSPKEERFVLGAITYSGINCGVILAMLMSGLIASSSFGWPGISYFSGVICLLWCVVWLILGARDPPSSRYITKMECDYIETSLNREENFHRKKIPIPWLAMLTSLPLLSLVFARCTSIWNFTTIQTQIPSYMLGVLHMNITKNALYSALPYVVRWLMGYVYIFFGYTAMKRDWLSLTTMRKINNTLGMWIPAFLLIGIGFLDQSNELLAIVLLVLCVGFEAGTDTGCALGLIDLAPNHAGIVGAISIPIGNIIPLITPLIAGALVTDVHNASQWQIVFGISAIIGFLGNLVYIIFSSSEPQPWNEVDFLQTQNNDISTREENKNDLQTSA